VRLTALRMSSSVSGTIDASFDRAASLRRDAALGGFSVAESRAALSRGTRGSYVVVCRSSHISDWVSAESQPRPFRPAALSGAPGVVHVRAAEVAGGYEEFSSAQTRIDATRHCSRGDDAAGSGVSSSCEGHPFGDPAASTCGTSTNRPLYARAQESLARTRGEVRAGCLSPSAKAARLGIQVRIGPAGRAYRSS